MVCSGRSINLAGRMLTSPKNHIYQWMIWDFHNERTCIGIVRKKYSDKGSIDPGPHPAPSQAANRCLLFTRNSRCSPGNTLRLSSTCINRIFNEYLMISGNAWIARKHEDLISIMVFHQELRTLFGNKLDRISWLPHRHEETTQKNPKDRTVIDNYHII